MATYPVIIVGAGPVGLLTALVLAKRDIPVLVLEAEPGLTVDLRAGTYHPPSMEMMAPYGIADDMLKVGIKVPRWQLRDRHEGVIVEWDLSELADVTPYPYRFHLEQHRLTPIIFARLAQCSNATVRFGSPVENVTQDADGATVHIRTAAGTTESLRAQYVVGADGGRSVVRKSVGLDFEGFTWPERFAVISTIHDFEQDGYAKNAYIADPDGWNAIFKMPGDDGAGLWRLVFLVHEGESDEDALRESRCQERLKSFRPQAEDYVLKYRSIYKVHQRVAPDFRRGRVVLAGDAAHLNNPLGAFGLNGGIHDAVNLGEKLAAVLRGESEDTLLDRYTRQRRTANIEQVQSVSIQNKKRLEARDPAARQQNIDDLRATAADPVARRSFLLTNTMITSVRRAALIE
ncbi:MAG: FAD-dependent monooxygenase [Burkholderiales bacterium]